MPFRQRFTLEIDFVSETELPKQTLEHYTNAGTPTNSDEFFEKLADIDDSAIRRMRLTCVSGGEITADAPKETLE